MLHHVPGNTPQEYTGSHQVIKEAYRILKDRGVLIVNTSYLNHTLFQQLSKNSYKVSINACNLIMFIGHISLDIHQLMFYVIKWKRQVS